MSEIHTADQNAGDWNLVGTADNDSLYGGKGDNHIIGGAGDDKMFAGTARMNGSGSNDFDGGTGEDTVVYSGNFAQYKIEFDATNGLCKVGGDTLKNVEYIQFSDVRMKVADAIDLQGTQHQSTAGDDQLVGNDFGYLLSGGDGNDSLTGNGGDDTLYGGKGEDVAVFRGNRADYDIRYDYNNGQYIVTDRQAGRDGQDHVASVEQLKFADTTIQLHTIDYGNPDDATIARLDGVIDRLPPPAAVDYGDLVVVRGIWDPADLGQVICLPGDVFAVDNLLTTSTFTTMSAALIGGDAAADHIALSGVTTFAASSLACGGYLLDTP